MDKHDILEALSASLFAATSAVEHGVAAFDIEHARAAEAFLRAEIACDEASQ